MVVGEQARVKLLKKLGILAQPLHDVSGDGLADSIIAKVVNLNDPVAVSPFLGHGSRSGYKGKSLDGQLHDGHAEFEAAIEEGERGVGDRVSKQNGKETRLVDDDSPELVAEKGVHVGHHLVTVPYDGGTRAAVVDTMSSHQTDMLMLGPVENLFEALQGPSRPTLLKDPEEMVCGLADAVLVRTQELLEDDGMASRAVAVIDAGEVSTPDFVVAGFIENARKLSVHPTEGGAFGIARVLIVLVFPRKETGDDGARHDGQEEG